MLAVGTMSFKMIEKSTQNLYWYVVDGDTIGGYLGTEHPCDDEGPTCAIAFSRNVSIPTDLTLGRADDDYQMEAEGKRPE